MIFNEIYIGRAPDIQQMCDIMGEARELYMNRKIGAARKKLYEMEGVAEKFFGFKSFSIDLINDPSINACTYPAVTAVDVNAAEALYTTSKEGYKFKKEAGICAISRLTTGLFGNKNFTNDEAFAIFLHEVGHSFVTRSPLMDSEFDVYQMQLTTAVVMQCICKVVLAIMEGSLLGSTDNKVKKIWYALLLGKNTVDAASLATVTNNAVKLFCSEFSKKIKQIPALSTTQFYLSKLKSFADRSFENAFDFIGTITGLQLLDAKLVQKQAEWIDPDKRPNAQARSWERLSDDFCTVYGYGNELATALLKMENKSYSQQTAYGWFKSHCPIVKTLAKKRYDILLQCIYQIDCHPTASDRIMSIIENMEHDIKTEKSLKSKEKKMLMDSLDKTNKLAKESAKLQGELAKNPDETRAALLALGFKNGSSEGKSERAYTDMKGLDAQFKELQDEASINIDILGWEYV